jgi:hypothetical protein
LATDTAAAVDALHVEVSEIFAMTDRRYVVDEFIDKQPLPRTDP